MAADALPPRPYYDRKRAEGRHHSRAFIALARRRSGDFFAMLGVGILYQVRDHETYQQAA